MQTPLALRAKMFYCVPNINKIAHSRTFIDSRSGSSAEETMFKTAEVMRLANTCPTQDGAVTPPVCDAVIFLLKHGAEKLLGQAVEADVDAFIEEHRGLKDDRGRQRVVRNGYLAARKIHTCLGEHTVRIPRVRDLGGVLHFRSRILSPYQRCTQGQMDRFLRAYLEGICCGDFHEALSALLGRCTVCISPTADARLTALWRAEHFHWINHSLSGTRWDDLPADQELREECGGWLGCGGREWGATIGATWNGTSDALALQEPSRDTKRWLRLLWNLQACACPLSKQLREGVCPDVGCRDGGLRHSISLAEESSSSR
jgi:hypothetical protein